MLEPSGRPMRMAVVSTHPIQYQCPVWRVLAQHPRISQFRVFFVSDCSVRGYRDPGFGCTVNWGASLLDGFDSTSFSNEVVGSSFDLGPSALFRSLGAFRPDVCLLNAYLPMVYLRAMLMCRRRGVRVVLRAEATDSNKKRYGLKSYARDWALRCLYRRIDAFASIGSSADRHYLRLGVSADRISRSPYCIDSEALEAQRSGVLPGMQRARLGVPDEAFVVLVSGKLSMWKRPLMVLDALEGVSHPAGRPVHVWFLGDGELRPSVEARAMSGWQGRVRVLGFLGQDQLAAVYADADMLVMASRGETWGLVVNEALACGIPAIVGERVGCSSDLVVDGETGFVFRGDDLLDLRRKVLDMAAILVRDRARVAEACRAAASRHSIQAAADGIVRAARVAMTAVQ
jgi:glycosyltransferase involved in cell wall biosynthesis